MLVRKTVSGARTPRPLGGPLAGPYVSNDNPFSEAQFKTLKYCPAFPQRFGSLADGRAFGHHFFGWYNNDHYHCGLGFLTPAVVHHGRAARVHAQRTNVLAAAYAAHPERFVNGQPTPADLPQAVWINPPEKKKGLCLAGHRQVIVHLSLWRCRGRSAAAGGVRRA